MNRHDSERGFGLVTALLAMAICALVVLTFAQASRVAVVGGEGELARARAEAAADAGFAIMLHHLAALDETALQAIAGHPQTIELDGAQITVRLIDERGKIPLNHSDKKTIERMLQQAGLDGVALAYARDGLIDWIADEDPTGENKAEPTDHLRAGIAPRNGGLLSIDELARVRGFSPELVNRLRDYVTVDPDVQAFDASHAQPRALAAMESDVDLSLDVIEREREFVGQTATLAGGDPKDLLHRPMTIAVDAAVPGGHMHYAIVVILTDKPDHPWDIHAVN